MALWLWHWLWLQLRLPLTAWRMAELTEQAQLAEHAIVARMRAITASHDLALDQVWRMEERLARALASLHLPSAKRAAVDLTNERIDSLAAAFLTTWRAELGPASQLNTLNRGDGAAPVTPDGMENT